jgi:hypothetical protein
MNAETAETEPARRRRIALDVAVPLAVAIVYFVTAARTVLGGDNGEFDTLFARGGVAHPPGFPLYVIWLRAMRWIPASSPAHGAALATAVLGVATVVVLQRACRAWGARAEIAAGVALVYAFSPLAWSLATSAETFTLNALVAAAIGWVSAPSRPLRGAKAVATLGLLAGLGLSNHLTIVLVAPLGLWAAVREAREAKDSPRRVIAVLAGIGGLVLGLTPYVQLVISARHAGWTWGGTGTASGAWHHFLRSEYGTLRLQSTGSRAPVRHLFAFLYAAIVDQPGFLLICALAARLRPAMRTRPVMALAAAFMLAGPFFVLVFNANLDDVGAVIVARFYLLPELLSCVIAAVAFESLAGEMRSSYVAGVGAIAAAIVAVRAVPLVREHNRPSVELYVRNTLSFLPPRAVLLGKGDHRFGGFLYAHEALGLRPDVAFVNPQMISRAWYRDYASSIAGDEIPAPVEGEDAEVTIARALLARGRDVFIAASPNEAEQAAFATFPIGTVTRVMPRGAPLPEPVSLMEANEALFSTFTLEDTRPASPSTWAGTLALSYARPWRVLAGTFQKMGDGARARLCADRAAAFAPWLGP